MEVAVVLNKVTENILSKSIAKFFIVSVAATCFNYATFYVLHYFFHIELLSSSAIGFLTGVILGYYLNKFWTYKSLNKKVNIVKYYGVYLFSLGISIIALQLFTENFLIDARIANGLCICITFFTNYLGTRFLVFK